MRTLLSLLSLLASASPLAAQSSAPQLVLLARHAETDATTGTDPGLSELGRARAEALADACADAGLTHVISSDLRRAHETAQVVAERVGLGVQRVPVANGLDAHVTQVATAVWTAGPGAVVLVVGHSNTVPAILAALGGPELEDLPHGDHGQLLVLAPGDPEASFVRARFADPEPDATSADAPEAAPGFDVNDPCPDAEYPDAATSPYVLPWPVGERHNVRQGNCNPTNTHNATYRSRFAYDFEMPIGSTIVAARAGRVFHVVERFTDDQHGMEQGNLLGILHDDGSYAVYGHLTFQGALVEVGDEVEAGQPVALSGNSGLSRGPHLHFVVKACDAGRPVGDPSCATVPVSFRNTRAHPRGLIGSPTSEIGGGEWYEALPLEGAQRR